ncbi:unnamed protein product [Urochloa humidicola]
MGSEEAPLLLPAPAVEGRPGCAMDWQKASIKGRIPYKELFFVGVTTLASSKAATVAFLASVSQALQAPLATMLPRGSAAAPATSAQTTPLRRSKRLSSQPLNSTVRASKKGEVGVGAALHPGRLYRRGISPSRASFGL